jgi:DNA-binding NarL/FixJ family response regulator
MVEHAEMTTPEQQTRIEVLLADDHPLIRAGLRATLALAEDIALVGEATSGDEAQRLCAQLQPQILLLDLEMPGPPAAITVQHLHETCPDTRVLVLTAHDDDAYVQGMLAVGIAGYMLKDEIPETLLHAIRGAARGGVWFSQRIVAKLVRAGGRLPVAPELNDRDRELLLLLERGLSSSSMASSLNLSEQTVRNYLSRLYGKLGVATRAEAMVWLREHPLA